MFKAVENDRDTSSDFRIFKLSALKRMFYFFETIYFLFKIFLRHKVV